MIIKTGYIGVLALGAMLACTPGIPSTDHGVLYPESRLREINFSEVSISGDFWYPKIRLVQQVTLPHLLAIAEAEGKIDNFRIVGGRKQGTITLHNAGDSDVYKLIEAAGYSLATFYDEALLLRMDSIIDIIASAQLPDGYLNTQYTFPDDHPANPDLNVLHARRFGYGEKDRWNSTLERWPYAYSQLYCAGHLMEAAVVYFQATGREKLLEIAVKLADHIGQVFDDERIKGYADHPQVEIGLMKLYEATGNPEYLELAGTFCRYIKFARPRDIVLSESSKPLYEQREAWSHCVRTGYIYTAATGVIRATGAPDLSEAIHSIWDNLNCCKIYVHGGVGNGTRFEQHGHNHDLPILDTYSESCAQIAHCQWNHELSLLHGISGYADIIEWEAYNAALSGYGLDGKTFLYANKLNLDTLHREDYHSGVRTSYLFCCPSKLPGFITGINRWIYTKDETGGSLYINQFIDSSVKTRIGRETVELEQQTEFPWEGKVNLLFRSDLRRKISLKIRIPGWNARQRPLPEAPYYFNDSAGTDVAVSFNGKTLRGDDLLTPDGYLTLHEKFSKGDQIAIHFDMPVRRVYTDAAVSANAGRVALSKGPVLYSLEGVDNDFDVLEMVLPAGSEVRPEFRPSLLGGVHVLTGVGLSGDNPVHFVAIPYYAWQNRGISQLSTLLIQDRSVTQREEATREIMNTDG